MLEPTTPTSEVVQTAYLAVKKAREHELRENVFFHTEHKTKAHRTTPFNSHMDLPVMAAYQSDFFTNEVQAFGEVQVEKIIAQIKVANTTVCLENSIVLSDDFNAYQLRLIQEKNTQTVFPELDDALISFVSKPNENDFLHSFFAALLKTSDEYINTIFSFDGFKRFSQQLNIKTIAEFSYQTRNIQHQDTRFSEHFQDMSYRVDASKAPSINSSELGDLQRQKINKFLKLKGYLPEGL